MAKISAGEYFLCVGLQFSLLHVLKQIRIVAFHIHTCTLIQMHKFYRFLLSAEVCGQVETSKDLMKNVASIIYMSCLSAFSLMCI